MSIHRSIRTALLGVATLALAPAAALAGSCPTAARGVDVTRPSTLPARGVADVVLTSIDVAEEPINLDGRLFRLRRLTIQPGGVVPWHSHGERPAIIYIVQGTVTEYASTCSVPIVHRAGESTPERSGTSHYWRNTGRGVAVLLSADLFPVDADPRTM